MAEVQSVKPGWSRWPIRSATFWCGALAGVGLGLLLAAAFVETGLLRPDRKAWASVLGIILFFGGPVVSGVAGRGARE